MLDEAARRHLQSAISRLSVKSALYQLSWLCGTMTPLCFAAAYVFRDYDHAIVVWLLRLGAAPLLITLGIAIGFAIFSPARLQSEDFQLRQHSLQLLQGRHRPEVIDADAVVAIANPELSRPPLPPAEGEQET
jgi:hypothetical protein